MAEAKLGSGMAEKARKKLKGRAAQLAEQEAKAMGTKGTKKKAKKK